MTVIDRATILAPADRCTVREQVGQYLIYNARTDELHLLPPGGYYVYSLCDGNRSVAAIHATVHERVGSDPQAAEQRLHEFLDKLVARGILEVCDG